ncbi:FecR family protein [Telluribacter sp.]|uniref:FecR family protein n=1 Tax=Telluribacter sp. TaxID=1978767 RepID=UPI002E12C0DF|nr:FecR domain-containing protein [Telluribacter sp.]
MEKQRYTNFSASEFLLDDDFLAWIKGAAPESDQIWEQWLSENPSRKKEVEKARLMVLAMSAKAKKVEPLLVNTEWKKIKPVIEERQIDWFPAETEKKNLVLPVLFRVAAAAVLLLFMVWAGRGMKWSDEVTTATLMQQEVADGQQLTIKLIDGTVIKLNAGSKLSYPKKFLSNKREVQLTGEAYFEVASRPEAPFIIHTDNVRIEVLGTKFTVKAYPEGENVKVAVVEGKVGVNTSETSGEKEKQQEEVYLTKNEMATFQKDKNELVVTSFNTNDLLGWKDGILFFEKASFSEIVRKLERWYGVKIKVNNTKKIESEWRFSGKFENKPLEYILDVCSYPNRFTYEVTDKEVIIN